MSEKKKERIEETIGMTTNTKIPIKSAVVIKLVSPEDTPDDERVYSFEEVEAEFCVVHDGFMCVKTKDSDGFVVAFAAVLELDDGTSQQVDYNEVADIYIKNGLLYPIEEVEMHDVTGDA